MQNLILVLATLIPTAGMVLLVYLFLKKQGEKEAKLLQLELKKERQEHFLPSRLEAYQRAVLLMERINPNSLVMRLHNPGLPARALQAEILSAIREEYDHNVAQQIFISPSAWAMVKNSKEETTKIINIAANQLTATATGMDLSAKILEVVAEVGELPTDITINHLKAELQKLF